LASPSDISARPAEARDEARGPPTIGPLRILVAEDNPVNRQVALGLLCRDRDDVDVVSNGRAAAEAVIVVAVRSAAANSSA
jgi:hypothetical protein